MPRSKPAAPLYIGSWERVTIKLERRAARLPAYFPTAKGRRLVAACHRFLDQPGPTLGQLIRVTAIIHKFSHWPGTWHNG